MAQRIELAHGDGGKLGRRLLERTVFPALEGRMLGDLENEVTLPIGGERVAFTTGSFVVSPIFFPGGDIGELAVNGTVNELATYGARPVVISLALILEEGLAVADLERVLASVRRAATRASVTVVTGHTKVVPCGRGDRVYLNATGIGVPKHGLSLDLRRVSPGDVVLVSGPVAEHGVAVMAARRPDLRGVFRSDTAPLNGLVRLLLERCPHVHALRAPTAGLSALLLELTSRLGLGVEIDEGSVPVSERARRGCERLGLDPIDVASQGALVAFAPPEHATEALEAMRAHALGREASRIGVVTLAHPGVAIATRGSGSRALDWPTRGSAARLA